MAATDPRTRWRVQPGWIRDGMGASSYYYYSSSVNGTLVDHSPWLRTAEMLLSKPLSEAS